MKRELDEQLCKIAPTLFGDRNADMRNTALCWGFEVGDGWYTLLKEAAEKLEPLCRAEAEKATDEIKQWYGGPPCRASQIKEKYGTLRFYMTSETDAMSTIIDKATSQSSKTCESCGKPGKLRGSGWLFTRCAACWKKEQK